MGRMTDSAPSRVANAKPFLKWAGGKSRLISQYEEYLPPLDDVRRYYEPFIGSAALFFHLQPPAACLSDRNRKLVEVFEVVRDDVEALIEALQPHKNEKAYYYEVRAQDPAELTKVERAARLIYMNKTCYNGLYRENQKGEFNVPFGRYKRPKICDRPRLRAASAALQGVHLAAADFQDAVAGAGEGDFVYFDPPYVPLNETSSFTSYSRFGFDETDHRRLADTCRELHDRDCRVMLSNSSADLVYELYERPEFQLVDIQASRSINSKADGRGPVKELLILNYEAESDA